MITDMDLNKDLLHNILERLQAASFASAACVNKSWNSICNHILSRPKFASAISLRPSLQAAAKEVIDKVLSNPIRPHFVIVNVGNGFGLRDTKKLMEKELGSQTPMVVSSVNGIIGRDALTNEYKEVKWGDFYCSSEEQAPAFGKHIDCGILLSIGYVPGLKVDVIPLLRPYNVPQGETIDKFVTDIRDYTASVSGCTSPVGIIMFGETSSDMKCVLDKLDYAMCMETFIVGNERCKFVYRGASVSRNVPGIRKYYTDAVALVFARDGEKKHYAEIQFHAALSTGISSVGPRYKAVSVRTDSSGNKTTWITAKRDGQQEILDGQQILDVINDELENQIESPDLYIGVTKRRNCSIGLEKIRLMTSKAFHAVIEDDEEYLCADGVGIRPGDSFEFYCSDPGAALSSCNAVSSSLKNLKVDYENSKNHRYTIINSAKSSKEEVFGGFIFSCYGRGEFDGVPILDNFPDLPLGGVCCGGEIGRVLSSLTGKDKDGTSVHCSLHIYSVVYLLMSFSE